MQALEKFQYDNKIVRNFALATIIWGVVGMLVGLWVALLMVFPQLNVTDAAGKETTGITYVRNRPCLTKADIFEF